MEGPCGVVGRPTGPLAGVRSLASAAGLFASFRRVTDRFPSHSVTVSADVGKRLGSALKKRYGSLQDLNNLWAERCSSRALAGHGRHLRRSNRGGRWLLRASQRRSVRRLETRPGSSRHSARSVLAKGPQDSGGPHAKALQLREKLERQGHVRGQAAFVAAVRRAPVEPRTTSSGSKSISSVGTRVAADLAHQQRDGRLPHRLDGLADGGQRRIGAVHERSSRRSRPPRCRRGPRARAGGPPGSRRARARRWRR